MKKIDELIIRSFIPPFILAFFIAVFVLIMQFLWTFIDDIIGKGASTIDIFEMLFYRSLSLVPLALPIGVLLASVMVFGNMSEKYELSSLKSAGVSLVRIMRPTIIFTSFVAAFSLFCSNTLIPLSNLKFQSRLWDIRNQKPALSLEEKVFNEDFKGFSIRIGEKEKDNKTIRDVLIYDHSSSTQRQYKLVSAVRGEMRITEDEENFVIKLYDGYQYQEMEPSTASDKSSYPFTRTRFKVWEKQFDLSEFELSRIDEDLFKSHHSMKSVAQLAREVDSFEVQFNQALIKNHHDFQRILRTRSADSSQIKNVNLTAPDVEKQPRVNTKPGRGQRKIRNAQLIMALDTFSPEQDLTYLYEILPEKEVRYVAGKAVSQARTLKDKSERLIRSLKIIRINRAKHIFELHYKFSIALVCVIFLFIGGPMGAIVRKGGYGYPLLVAVIFFTFFIILNLICKKLMETETLNPIIAAWLPCIIMLPLGLVLTYKAMMDSKLLNVDTYFKPILKVFARDTKA